MKKTLKKTVTKGKNMTAKKENAPEIIREGNTIVLPPGKTYAWAREWLTKQEQAEETVIAVSAIIECFPLDGVVALAKALKEIYGFTEDRGSWGFFGPRPPAMVQVPLADGTFATAPLGRLCPPKWEGGFVQAAIHGPSIVIGGEIKKKFEGESKDLIAKTRDMLRENSIYRGQAISLDLSWYGGDDDDFDVIRHSPKFMELGDAKIILNKNVEFLLETSVYMLIERTEQCLANHISPKHGLLAGGEYGTGKTLMAKVVAKKCVKNGWGFMYLQSADQLASGLRIAKTMGGRWVVFAEDIDRISGERNDGFNDLLNVLDGVDTKDAPIITILTTNHPELIQPAFLRAGRIDTLVKFSLPDAETAARFVTEFAQNGSGSLVKPGEDMKAVGESLKGLVPAFICEAVAKAKRYAIYRTGETDLTGQITSGDLVMAAGAVREHLALMNPKTKTVEEKAAESLRDTFHYALHGSERG